MRLIDADDIVYESIDSSDTSRYEYYYGTGIMAVRKEDIDAMPTIEERKTGRWEMLYIPMAPPPHKCSVCGKPALCYMTGCLVNRHLKEELTNFCPNCGADMRGGQDENR